ncbi:MAG TPA: SufE family protein [Hyphomicrobiaceae bacterium]|nr:SufE family protein [Hyphomicrobiaceae bacterium]
MTNAPIPTLETIESDFSFLDDWEDRYRYVIELGRALLPLDPSEKTSENKVRGCASQVWLVAERGDGAKLRFRGESDAHIVQGLIAILLSIYDDKTAAEITAIDAHGILRGLGLDEHLTPQRSNGLKSMIERIRTVASGEA